MSKKLSISLLLIGSVIVYAQLFGAFMHSREGKDVATVDKEIPQMAEDETVMQVRNLIQEAFDDLTIIQGAVNDLAGTVGEEYATELEERCNSLRDKLNDIDNRLGTLVQSNLRARDTYVDDSLLCTGDVLTIWVHNYNIWCSAVVIRSSPKPRVIVTSDGELKDKVLDAWQYNVKSIQRGGILTDGRTRMESGV